MTSLGTDSASREVFAIISCRENCKTARFCKQICHKKSRGELSLTPGRGLGFNRIGYQSFSVKTENRPVSYYGSTQ